MASRYPTTDKCVNLSRVYDPVAGGYRILVDRLWPRGVSKRGASLDEWLKDIAPTTELRTWYGHEGDRFAEFKHRYQRELDQPSARHAVDHILHLAQTERVVLLTATRDIEHSAARVLLDHLQSALSWRRLEEVDEVVDGWGRDSFPASDPPGSLPPTLASGP